MPIAFTNLVQNRCSKDVLQIPKDHPVLKILSDGLDRIIKKSEYTNYEGKRINDLGRSFEAEIKDIITNDQSIELLPYSQHMGYPDLRLKMNGDVVFIEIKSTSKGEDYNSTQRVFFFSKGTKITSDGYHILIQLYFERTVPNLNSFKFKKWKIKDLYSLNVVLKEEYNASYRDLNDLSVLCSSD